MCAPWSLAATSKAVRVRVDVFSKISAMFLPARRGRSYPAYLAALRSADSFSRNVSSSGVKSSSLRKLRWRRLYDIGGPLLRWRERGGAAGAESARVPSLGDGAAEPA